MNSTLPLLPYLPTFPASPIMGTGAAGGSSKLDNGYGDTEFFDPSMYIQDERKDSGPMFSASPEEPFNYRGYMDQFIHTNDNNNHNHHRNSDPNQYLNLDQPGPSTYAQYISDTPITPGIQVNNGVQVIPNGSVIGGTHSHNASTHSVPSLVDALSDLPSSAGIDGSSPEEKLNGMISQDDHLKIEEGDGADEGDEGDEGEEEVDQLAEVDVQGGEGDIEDSEEPLYVNAKQYHRILKRRLARARLEELNRLSRSRKPYLHESRHRHACNRPRGKGGRFLTADEIEAMKREEAAKGSGESSESPSGASVSDVQQ